MLTEQQTLIHKEFRKYLRTEEGQKGIMLNTIINAAENNLPVLLREHVKRNFGCIYDDIYTIEELVSFSAKLKADDEIIAGPSGYISSLAIDAYIRFYTKKNGINLSAIRLPNEESSQSNQNSNENELKVTEGVIKEVKYFRNTRNRNIRDQCAERDHYTCQVCGFNFEKVYGERGKGFIEIHHRDPMANYDGEHEIKLENLVALCSNCHSMIHYGGAFLDIDELKKCLQSRVSHLDVNK